MNSIKHLVTKELKLCSFIPFTNEQLKMLYRKELMKQDDQFFCLIKADSFIDNHADNQKSKLTRAMPHS